MILAKWAVYFFNEKPYRFARKNGRLRSLKTARPALPEVLNKRAWLNGLR